MQSADVYRRAVLIRTTAVGASADIEDDFHCFGADVRHDGVHVTEVVGRAKRTPWTTCPLAVAQLQALVGLPLMTSPFETLREIDQRQQCTHMMDMAALAIAASGMGLPVSRRWDVAFGASSEGEVVDRRVGEIALDGGPGEPWMVEDQIIQAPPRFAGKNLWRASSWADDLTDLLERERVFVMRRAALVAGGRRMDLDHYAAPSGFPEMTGSCFVFQPMRIDQGRRIRGNSRNFDRPNDLLTDAVVPR